MFGIDPKVINEALTRIGKMEAALTRIEMSSVLLKKAIEDLSKKVELVKEAAEQ